MLVKNKYSFYYYLFSCLFIIFILYFLLIYKKEEEKTSNLIVNKVMFKDLPGWNKTNIFKAKISLERSCNILSKKGFSETVHLSNIVIKTASYKNFCAKLKTISNNNALKQLLISSFYPVLIESSLQNTHFTGYIELELKGRLSPNFQEAPNAVPIFKRPKNLITIDLGPFKKEFKNHKITAILIKDKIIPVPSRKEIETENLYADSIIAYIDDPARAYFLHIQGSGIIKLANGKSLSVGFDGDNGKEYFSIGKLLIQEGIISKEKMSMQAIIQWMENNSEAAIALRHKNERFIFFKERNVFEGPIGSSGAIVTAMHTAAVDNNFLPYHLPLWAEIDNFYSKNVAQKYFNLFVSQDTGSAIKGPTRIDLFLGKGSAAENIAGKLNSKGKLWALIPK